MAKGQRRRSTSKGNGDKTRQMHDQLMAEIAKVDTASGWKALLQIREQLHHYSFPNVMTIHEGVWAGR